MKFLSSILLLLIFLFFIQNIKAQNFSVKRNLFDAFGNTLSLKISELEKIFFSSTGNQLQINFGDNKINLVRAVLVSSVQRYQNLKSIVLKLSDFDGSILSISKRINSNNSVTYVGRIINEKYADGYELKIDVAGNYFLKKIKLDDLIQDHE